MEGHVKITKQQPDTHRYVWHCRLSHLGMNNVNKLIDENMISGMDGVSNAKANQFCEWCAKGKQHRIPIQRLLIIVLVNHSNFFIAAFLALWLYLPLADHDIT